MISPATLPERIGILGGTFDPVHLGHITAANTARRHLQLDRVLFVVAGDPWQKRGQVKASPRDRLDLVVAALADQPGLEGCDLEVKRREPSVTADTLEDLAVPGRELFLILGADAVANMSTWRRLVETRDLATVVVMERAGELASPPGPGWKVEHVAMPAVDVSSSVIRANLAARKSIAAMVPEAVATMIAARNLYDVTK